MKKLYDIRIFLHLNDKGDESERTVAEADAVPLDAVVDFIKEYVSGNYEVTVREADLC